MQFERPIPGQSLTTESKGAPFERPPEIAEPLEALDRHLDALDNPGAVQEAMFFLEMGVDLVTLVEGITRNAVMQGIHSIDVSLIISPVIHEYIKGYADAMNIEYDEGFGKSDHDEKITYARNEMLARKVLSEMSAKRNQEGMQEEMPTETPAPQEEGMSMMEAPPEPSMQNETKGLMAR